VLLIPPWMEGVAFTVAEGRRVGLTDAAMRRVAFERPFRGVRVAGTSGRTGDQLVERCRDLRVVLPSDALFSHATAARLWRMPLPSWLDDGLHVLTPNRAPVRRPGVIGWTRGAEPLGVGLVHGLPVTTPADTWVSLATMTGSKGGRLTREWLVAIGDFLVSGRRTLFGRELAPASLDDLAAAVELHGSRRGAVALNWALARLRSPVDSPPESFLRLGLVAAGLPEPDVQPTIRTAAGDRHPDLAYVEARLLIEYLGDVHRVDPRTWRDDLTRVQLLQDAGYRVILAGSRALARRPPGVRSSHSPCPPQACLTRRDFAICRAPSHPAVIRAISTPSRSPRREGPVGRPSLCVSAPAGA